MPDVRGEDAPAPAAADGAAGFSAVLPEMQAGAPDQRAEFSN